MGIIAKGVEMYNRKKIIIIISAILAFIIVIIVVSLILMGKGNNISDESINDLAGEEINDNSLYFKNRFFIDDLVGHNRAGIILSNIEDFILDNNELKSAPHENYPTDDNSKNTYTANIDIYSYNTLKDQSSPTIKLLLDISDGRKYQLYIKTDENYGENFITVVLDNLDSHSNILYLNYSNYDGLDTIMSWGKELLRNQELKIITNQVDLNINN